MEKMQDPMKVANNVYKFIMENDRVRVLEASFKPGDKAVIHNHPDHVVYVLEGGKIKLTSSGKTDVLDMKSGQAIFSRLNPTKPRTREKQTYIFWLSSSRNSV